MCPARARCKISTPPTSAGSTPVGARCFSPVPISMSSRPVSRPTSHASSRGCARRFSQSRQRKMIGDGHARNEVPWRNEMSTEQDRTLSGELPDAHRPRPGGSFDATVITFAAMGLFDSLTADQRGRVLLPQADPGRHGLPLGELDRHQEVLAHRLIAESMSVPAYARVVQVMANEHVLRELN